MDRSHQLDAPDNEALKTIEQVADHSELSTLYRHAKSDFDGELVSDTEREKRRKHKFDTISFGIRKDFFVIGFLIPLPLLAAWIFVTLILSFVTEKNAPLIVTPAIFAFLLWAVITFLSYRKVSSLFYTNALQAGPFIVALLTLLGLTVPIIYTLTIPLHVEQLSTSALVVSGLISALSILITIPLLRIWTTPSLSGNAKFGIIGLVILILLTLCLYVTMV